MTNALRLYLHYLSQSVRSQMQYRASFIMLSFGHFLTTGVEFLAIAAPLRTIQTYPGLDPPRSGFSLRPHQHLLRFCRRSLARL